MCNGDLSVRIIPALAGNTPGECLNLIDHQDHPRSRGEYWASLTSSIARAGSSPLSRGIQTDWKLMVSCGRIIPALAGNTDVECESIEDWEDHPRSRGEYDH